MRRNEKEQLPKSCRVENKTTRYSLLTGEVSCILAGTRKGYAATGYNACVSTPLPLLRPYEKLIKIQIAGREFEVPEKNVMLRVFQFLSPEEVSMGRFCWNEDCQYCRVTYDTGEGTTVRKALSCKLMVEEGMRIVDSTAEIKYGLRKVLE